MTDREFDTRTGRYETAQGNFSRFMRYLSSRRMECWGFFIAGLFIGGLFF